MAKKTSIAWCDSTANSVIGCTKISDGCKFCYAVRCAPARILRAGGVETWGEGGTRVAVSGFSSSMQAMNRKPWVCSVCGTMMNPAESLEHEHDAKHPQFRQRRVFVNSMSDWLDEKWPIGWLAEFLSVVGSCANLEVIMCSKRPHLFYNRLRSVVDLIVRTGDYQTVLPWLVQWVKGGVAPKHITVMWSVCNQWEANKIIPLAARLPAARRALSFEPLLGPVGVQTASVPLNFNGRLNPISQFDQVVIGGESGKRARPSYDKWIRDLAKQCKRAGCSVFIKQVGSNPFTNSIRLWPDGTKFLAKSPQLVSADGTDSAEWPEDLRLQEWGRQ